MYISIYIYIYTYYDDGKADPPPKQKNIKQENVPSSPSLHSQKNRLHGALIKRPSSMRNFGAYSGCGICTAVFIARRGLSLAPFANGQA